MFKAHHEHTFGRDQVDVMILVKHCNAVFWHIGSPLHDVLPGGIIVLVLGVKNMFPNTSEKNYPYLF
jgi:ABC-type microcin C transport system permease subunit YejB